MVLKGKEELCIDSSESSAHLENKLLTTDTLECNNNEVRERWKGHKPYRLKWKSY